MANNKNAKLKITTQSAIDVENNNVVDEEEHTPFERMQIAGSLYEKYFVNAPSAKESIPALNGNDYDLGKQQRIYYCTFGNNIRPEFINGYKVYQDKETEVNYIYHSASGMKLQAESDVISVSMPDKDEEQQRAVELAIKVAIDSGIQITEMVFEGDEKFVAMANAELARIKADPVVREKLGLDQEVKLETEKKAEQSAGLQISSSTEQPAAAIDEPETSPLEKATKKELVELYASKHEEVAKIKEEVGPIESIDKVKECEKEIADIKAEMYKRKAQQRSQEADSGLEP